MPNIEPPAAGLLRPAHRTVVTAGTVVWRVHRSPDGAIAEIICRDLLWTHHRPDRARQRRDRPHPDRLTVTRTLTNAALHGPHLSAVGQDLRLTKCEARHYVTTRRGAHAIQTADPNPAAGRKLERLAAAVLPD